MIDRMDGSIEERYGKQRGRFRSLFVQFLSTSPIYLSRSWFIRLSLDLALYFYCRSI